MELSEFAEMTIVDCHTHIGGEDLNIVNAILDQEAQAGVDELVALVTSGPRRVNVMPQAICAKAKRPDKIYLFAGMDYSHIASDVDHRWTYSFPRQIDRLIAMGADGLKMINGKPNVRKASGIALDSPIYEDYWAKVEETGLPVLWHVNDPEEFWDPEAAPEWAKGPGWLYDDTFPTNESLYAECERVLDKHPKAKIIFAHFYFLSDFLDRAAAFLDRYPEVNLDLTPGIEMFHNFSKRPEQAREFFLKYQDRILFGTDFTPGSPLSRIWVIRNFLETDETFHVPTDERLFWPDHRTMITGIKLPEDVLSKIYEGNFRRIVGKAPKPLDMSLVMEELNRLTAIHDAMGAKPNMARKVAEELAADDGEAPPH